MEEYLKTLSNTYRNVELQGISKTAENRSVYLVKITSRQDHICPVPKKVILMDAAIEGNDWITTSVALKTIHELVVNYEENIKLLERFDWYILPMVNPDGYQFSRQPLFLHWKKNRSPNGQYFGTNLNQNFASNWNKLYSKHSSPWSQNFIGNNPFSELESNIIGSLMTNLLKEKKAFLYITLHTSTAPSVFYPEPFELSPTKQIEMSKNIAFYGSKMIFEKAKPYYAHIPPKEFRRLGGTSLDYAYEQGIPLTFSIALFEEHLYSSMRYFDNRAIVGWNGVFGLVEGAVKYGCNSPLEDKCKCLQEEDEEEEEEEKEDKKEKTGDEFKVLFIHSESNNSSKSSD
ncbi:mast cell carboxypeptidase A-like [Drosophila eugracilis]|uniref:mast cell carboxypeptidase A-like n=1 Tax=Drosophila eugracilis TaxID=29029 RepID=UPI0007E6460A|nr:mast cell carboxypeptidase A-like [Drosophila eugracilis]